MEGPYTANKNGAVSYNGNNVFKKVKDISKAVFPVSKLEIRAKDLHNDEFWEHISQINNSIYNASNNFFQEKKALFTPLPLTTRMISSPGAVYGKEAINYTTDTCPITLKWFDLKDIAFLSESSQIYLELALTQKKVDKVYSIYNSFRKEKADAVHLSEFHHIEFEGKVSQKQNVEILHGLVKTIIKECLKKNKENLLYFLNDSEIIDLKKISQEKKLETITYKQALDILWTKTHDLKYKKFTLQIFGTWEEVFLSNQYSSLLGIEEFPLLEIPFYHAKVNGKNPAVAECLDILWPGYKEFGGSGHRVRNKRELEEKARIFNLPKKDYTPYLQTRELPRYKETSGFGVGWERLLQGLLKTPYIWSAAAFPRGHTTLRP